MSPLMEQYFAVKEQYKDFLLFYRVGDFYEMFYDDAILASRVLELTLTGKLCGEEERAPMCGVPFHAADVYIGKLIEKGYKVAICEQMEDPNLAKGLVKRDVIRVVTPGTVIESNLLSEKKNNYLCAVCIQGNSIGVCFTDASTGQVYASSFTGEHIFDQLKNEIATYSPSEIICNLSLSELGEAKEIFESQDGKMFSSYSEDKFEYNYAKPIVKDHFGDALKESEWEDSVLISSIGASLSYLAETEKSDISYIRELHVYYAGQFMELDVNSRRNLELTESMRTKEKKGSLLWVLDKTKTSAGARTLRKWVEHPLLHANEIYKRQGAVQELYDDFMLRENLGLALEGVLDLERLVARIVYGSANGKDLRAVENTANVLPDIKSQLKDCKSDELSRIYKELDTLDDIKEKIHASIVENPPFSLREGGVIANGYNQEVDYLRGIRNNSKALVEEMAEKERENTGIKTLKISYNKVFGYYIEVTNSFLSMVPETYIRKQTLAGAERYITEELKQMETTILGAEEKICALEYELFQEVRAFVSNESKRLQKVASLLSELDAYLSLATIASKNKYVCPEITQDDILEIKDGRHPVVEQFVKDTYFVPNDALLDTHHNRLMLITGPNMAGKSTYMRQIALIVIMAQIGSFVPAKFASVGIVDKVFTRVGASDDLASGQSTFMLEMNEVAYILKNATRHSLIVYDEVGRGTSTYDGMSIARSIVEYTAKKIGARTLFATHYHELTSMEGQYEGVVNYNIAAKKRGDSIIFLRKILRGSTDDSYGIEVAKLAGIPNEIVKRAKEILASVEDTAKAVAQTGKVEKEETDQNLSLEDCMRESVIEELKAADINTLSPFECMSFLFDLKKKLE